MAIEPAPADNRRTVLVADDDAVLLKVARTALGRAGYRVLTASEGAQVPDLLRSEAGRIGVIVIDLGMRGLGGRAALSEIRKLAPGVPLILAGGSIFRLPGAAGRAGMEDYISKPYGPDEIREVVNTAFANLPATSGPADSEPTAGG